MLNRSALIIAISKLSMCVTQPLSPIGSHSQSVSEKISWNHHGNRCSQQVFSAHVDAMWCSCRVALVASYFVKILRLNKRKKLRNGYFILIILKTKLTGNFKQLSLKFLMLNGMKCLLSHFVLTKEGKELIINVPKWKISKN